LAFFAVKFFFTAKLAKNVAKNAKPNYAPLLCVLCESLAFFAVKFFLPQSSHQTAAKSAKPNHAPALHPLRILGVLRG